MSAKKLILFFVVLFQVAILAITGACLANSQSPEIFIYLEAGFVALVLLCGLVWGISSSFGKLFFALGGFLHIVITLAVVAATGYFAVASPDDLMLIIFLGACSLVMIVSIVPILCAKK